MKLNRPIDIIIPVYKNVAMTKHCIDSVLDHIHEISDYEPSLVVINDSPDDEEIAMLLDNYSKSLTQINIVTNKKNIGFVKSVNIALGMANVKKHDVILINSDTVTFDGTLLNLVDVANADSQLGFVSPRSNNASFCSFPLLSYGPKLLSPEESYLNWKSVAHLFPKSHITPTAVGFYLFIKCKILSNFGGLCENFGMGYEEENDLIMRANKVGYRAALANHSFAYHHGSASFSLQDFDLTNHRSLNLQKMAGMHPEFLPLVSRYENSAHFRAELLLSSIITNQAMKKTIAIDLFDLGCNHNGTNELALNIIKGLSKIEAIDLTIICSKESFDFHGLNKYKTISRASIEQFGKYQVAIRLGQPFDLHQINRLESAAPINIYGMLDTIAEDCGHLSITQRLNDYWAYVSRNANGVFCISKSSENSFITRFTDAKDLPKYTKLLPTKLCCYESLESSKNIEHVLIVGNHFPHKASDKTADYLSKRFTSVKFVVLGSSTFNRGNLQGFRSGTLEQEFVKSLYSRASVVVLPSYVEGFGFSVMHALAAKKPLVARNIDATNEILSTFKLVDGVYLYDNDDECADALMLGMEKLISKVDDSETISWDDWATGLVEFSIQLMERDDVFNKLVRRVEEGDNLRIKHNNKMPVSPMTHNDADFQSEESLVSPSNVINNLPSLLALDDFDFVCSAYDVLLKRKPDNVGLPHFLAKLRSGTPKIDILKSIKNSSEGRAVGAELDGLNDTFADNCNKISNFITRHFNKRRSG